MRIKNCSDLRLYLGMNRDRAHSTDYDLQIKPHGELELPTFQVDQIAVYAVPPPSTAADAEAESLKAAVETVVRRMLLAAGIDE